MGADISHNWEGAIHALPLISRDEEKELITQYQANGDMRLMHKVINGNLRFVLWQAHRLAPNPLIIADMFQVGGIALLKLLPRYNPNYGVSLTQYAARDIEHHMLQYARSQRTIKTITTKSHAKIMRALLNTQSSSQHDVMQLVADATECSINEVRDVIERLGVNYVSIDECNEIHSDMLPPDIVLENAQERKLLESAIVALHRLPPKTRDLMVRRFLLNKQTSLSELAASQGVSTQAITQQIEKACAAIRQYVEKGCYQGDFTI